MNAASTPPLLRSMLFVPGDSTRKLARCHEARADAVILDLEDAVLAARKPAARELVAAFLSEHARPRRPGLWVRINPIGSRDAEKDLEALIGAAPDGLVVPKVESPAALVRLATELDALERRHGLPAGGVALAPIVTETPRGLFALAEYSSPAARLSAMTWGAEDLSAALGATQTLGDDGRWLPTYALARSLCLLAAHAVGAEPIDTVWTRLDDAAGLARQAHEARRDGFRGKLAIHPGQVAAINAAFTPTTAEIEQATRVVDAFAAADGAGAIALDGRMLDRPHLANAQYVLALAARLEGAER